MLLSDSNCLIIGYGYFIFTIQLMYITMESNVNSDQSKNGYRSYVIYI